MKKRRPYAPVVLAALIALAAVGTAAANSQRDAIIASYASQAGGPLDAARGQALFTGTHAGGKPDTPSCTTCHTQNLSAMGQTRAGKAIEPMAVSANPARFTDPAKVEKWFGRNCNTVLGRDCTAEEKGDILSWLNTL
jgi:mono/diheme cytochrome c family protein